MRRIALIAAVVVAVLTAATLAGAAVAPGTNAAGPPAQEVAKLKREIAALKAQLAALQARSPEAVRRQLETVERVTDRFESVDAATARGYVQGSPCESSPQGGMGFHYINPAAIQDPKLDPLKPEVLLYSQANRRAAADRRRVHEGRQRPEPGDRRRPADAVRSRVRRADARPFARDADPLRPACLAAEAKPERDVRSVEPRGVLQVGAVG